MNMELKSAWYTLAVVGTALVLCLILGATTGFPVAFASLGVLGLLGFTPMLFRKEGGKSDCDERDLEVVRDASLFGGMCSYLAFVFGGMAIWFVHYFKGDEQVSIHSLPGLVYAGGIVLYLARSVYIISQYTPKALGSNE